MPSGDQGTPEFFRCTACLCHRSFHRKETVAHGGGKPDLLSSGLWLSSQDL
ncbi:hypothetical protein BT93_H1091 [Corymbia citriodora subsp. variegata]|nr:hypothetical protein BT93_H1091 [Corymbia citriodora subsp. variegata]